MSSYEPSDYDVEQYWQEGAEEWGLEPNGPERGIRRQVSDKGLESLSEKQRWIYGEKIVPFLKAMAAKGEAAHIRDLLSRDGPP